VGDLPRGWPFQELLARLATRKRRGIGLCPLPNSDLFQLMMQLRPLR